MIALKVVHLNTYDGNGGAGRAVLRLNNALAAIGVDSSVVTLYQFDEQSGVSTYANSLVRKIKAVFNILSERYLVKLFVKDKSVPFSLQRFGISPKEIEELRNADIIHIHWINHGFFSPKNIQELHYFFNKKIFWTLHDSNPITGGCHVRYSCDGFLKECGRCPVLSGKSAKDLSNRTWALKKEAYEKLDFQIIAPSKWMRESASKASLTKDKQSFFIANALDTDFFVPKDRNKCRAALGLPQDCFIILAGYMPSTSDRHKGFTQLKEAIANLSSNPAVGNKNLFLLFYGSDGTTEADHIAIPHKFFGKVTNDTVLVNLYNAADVFLFPSIEESMGYTALESLSCGIPVVAFNTSGVTDVVVHKHNGYLANLYNSEELAEGILWIMNTVDRKALAENARIWAQTRFSLQVIAEQHYYLYLNQMDKLRK